MSRVQSFKITNVPNDNHLPFVMMTRDIALQSEVVSTQFSVILTPFSAAIAAEDLAMHPLRGNDLTAKIEETDAQRDAAYYVVSHTVDVFLHYPDGAEKADAMQIEKYLKANGVKASAQYDRETGMLHNLVQDLERYCADEVERLGLTAQVARLKALNQLMYELLLVRNEQNSEKEKEAVRDARRKTDELYHALVNGVNAFAVVNPEPYLDFIRQMNELIERLSLQVLKITGAAADKNEVDGFAPGDETPGTEGGDNAGTEEGGTEGGGNTDTGNDNNNGGTTTPGGSIPTNPQPGDGDDPDLYIYGF